MTTALTSVNNLQLDALVCGALLPHLKRVLSMAEAGQRLRVSALPEPVMDHLCRSLQGSPDWCARVLTTDAVGQPWHATATKLIELRNSLDVPLVVFLPPGLRTAAEDSLDIATFHELPLASLAGVLREELLSQLPIRLAEAVREVLGQLQLEKRVRNDDELIEYLLTIVTNGGTPEAAGGAVYCFGLVPDFQLFTRGSTPHWLSRNFRAVEHLTATQPIHTSVHRLPLKRSTIQKALAAFLRERSPRDVRSWAREIATEDKYRSLAVDCWEFADEGNEEELRLVVSDLALPRQTEDKIGDAAQLRVLNLEGREPLTVSFRSIPPPPQAPGWKSWRVQLIAVREGETAVAWESNNYSKPARHAKVSRKIKLDQLQGLDEGTYFYKVDAYDADGALITKPHRLGDENAGRAENESERFLIVSAEAPVEERDIRAKFVPSLLDAWVLAASTALGAKQKQPIPERGKLRGEWDIFIGAAPKGEVHFELKTDGALGYSIVVPAMLRKVEREILEHPEQLGMYSLSFVDARRVADVELKSRAEASLGEQGSVERFLAARRQVFDAISSHHLAVDVAEAHASPKARLGVVEVVDLVVHRSLVNEYADSYICLCEEAALGSANATAARGQVHALAQLDVVELRWRPSPGDPGRALMVAPTHPLHLLWHLNHATLCAATVQHWSEGTRKAPNFRALLEQVLTSVLPINLPMVVFDRRGRGYVEQTPLTQHWSLYLPDRGEQSSQIDAVASRDRLLGHMGIRDRAISVRTVDPNDVAVRIFDYLAQHPYVEQLKLNIFNPGDGRLVADVLRKLEHWRRTDMGIPAPSLRYSVQMFASAENVEGIGEGLESLLDPERQVAEDDEFSLASSNHLLPKLVFARNTVQDFLEAPKRYSAHVSLLLEQFVVQCRVGRVDELHQGSYVRGLVQEPETEVEVASGTQFGWLKGLNAKVRDGADEAEKRLVKAVVAAQRVQASYALGAKAEPNLAPVVALQLDASGQALLKEVHERSDWVLTLDRNLGLDYFDSPSSSSRTGYLLDFTPEYLQEDRQRILLTTRSTVELEQIVRPVLNHYGLELRERDPVLVLETLRSLSGRLALRLESGRTQASEVVGLLLARWLLERLGVLQNRVVIPLDAHRRWFGASDDTSQRRADLLLVGFEEPAGLQVDIVEVKLREELPDAARSALYSDMRRQTENTEHRFRELFDPDLYPGGRADGPLRAKELASALSFYVRRALRYGLLAQPEYHKALRVLERLDNGYTLDIRSLGVVFEHQGRGLHQDEDEPGFIVHRFGGDKARQLLADAAGRLDEKMAVSSERKKRPSSIPPSSAERASEAALLTDAELQSIRSALARSPDYRPATVPPLKFSDSQAPHGSRGKLPASPPSQLPSPVRPQPSQALVGQPAPQGDDAASEGGSNASSAAQPEPPFASQQGVTQHGTMPSAAGVQRRAADVLLGATEFTPQYGVLGKRGTDKVGIDLNGCNTISLFGVQGFGKSYTLGVIAEMASRGMPGVNELPSPLATVIFHYHKSDAYEPEYASAVAPNSKVREVERLMQEFGAVPCGLEDVVLLSPEAKVEQRKAECPNLDVRPIKFASSELGAESWKFLLGAYGNDSLYIRQLVAIMRKHRSALTLDKFREEIEAAGLATAARRLAEDRLNLAQPYIDDACKLGDLLRPGRTVIVDLRDEWIEKDEALGLFVVMLRIFAATKYEGRQFNKLVVFDEAHKYITESDLISQVVETIREMRHQATSIVIASQDPLSVPRAVIELTSIMVLHRMTSPQWLKHLRSGLAALNDVDDNQVSTLRPGEALVWAQRSTDPRFTQRPQKVSIRPRFSQHGGGTKTAVAGATVR